MLLVCIRRTVELDVFMGFVSDEPSCVGMEVLVKMVVR